MPRPSARKVVEVDLSLAAGLVLASSPEIDITDLDGGRFEAHCLLLARLSQCRLIASMALLPDVAPGVDANMALTLLVGAYRACVLHLSVTSEVIAATSSAHNHLIEKHHHLLAIIADAYSKMQSLRYLAPRVPRGRKPLKELLFQQIWRKNDATFAQVVSRSSQFLIFLACTFPTPVSLLLTLPNRTMLTHAGPIISGAIV